MGDGPAVFGGDMNVTVKEPETGKDWEKSWVYRKLIDNGFIDPFIQGKFPVASTSSAGRLDYVWMRGLEAKVLEARVLPSTASDHRMVVVSLAFW